MHLLSGRWVAVLLATALLLVGCETTPSPAYQNYLDLADAEFRLPIPNGWGAAPAGLAEVGGHELVAYLSNQELQVDCVDATDQSTCFGPVPYLADGALLAWWTTQECPGEDCALPDGDALLVGGRQATRTRGTEICSRLGATDELDYIVQVGPHRLDTVISCERNVPADVRQVFVDALAAVDWRTP